MTNNQLIDERVTSVIERLEHYACNLKWTNVRGAQDLLTAADGLRELQERRKAAMDSEPVAEITEDLGRLFVKIHSPTILRAGDKLYRHAQPAPELDAIVERLNLSGYEYEGGEVTPQNAAAIVDTLLQQLDDAVQGRNAQPAPVVPDGYVMVPIEPTMSQELAGYKTLNDTGRMSRLMKTRLSNIYRAMLAAAPQFHGSDPAIVPDTWIPVSERMPEDEQEVLTINRMGHRFVSFFDKHSGLFFDRLDAPSACCKEHVLVTHWMELPAAPQEVK
ncbi:DUF551 domain-containing protein [Klebsiella aerogenes]|uniref:DUF551 domain-containing protein n=1 Tax=Klebsiella aerogenes TaxID=548 RepID=UPI00069C180D|nr:DUF551 domain-containing protein [Klebsiella aerogenes]